MIKSMTGYGKGEAVDESGRCVVEIKSVNNRYGESSLKMPRCLTGYEQDLRKVISERIKRGKIDVFVQWEPASSLFLVPSINHIAAKGYHQAFLNLAHELHISAEIPLSLIISQRNVIEDIVSDEQDDISSILLRAVNQALDGLDAMRIREGDILFSDLKERCTNLAFTAGQIKMRAPQVVEEYQNKLQQRLAKLLAGTEIDHQRLFQEVALLADRTDITEELVRLDSHFTQFNEAFLVSGPVGRKLDFMMQEINREVNTIGSKANDSVITTLVVQIKTELEKMREQIQNIE